MCYSLKTSLISFSLGILSSIFCFKSRQYILGTLILFYSQMQLSEAMIWKGIDDNDIELNKFGTLYGKYILPTHNIAIGLGILLSSYYGYTKKDWRPLIIGLLFYLYIMIIYYRDKSVNLTYPSCNNTRNCNEDKGRLVWPYPHSWYIISFIISIILCFMYIKPLKSKLFLISIFILTFIFTVIYKPKNIGSVWCFLTVILAPFIVFINYLLIKDTNNVVS